LDVGRLVRLICGSFNVATQPWFLAFQVTLALTAQFNQVPVTIIAGE
jgi:hypothetical protein